MQKICPWGRRLYSAITPDGASRFRYSSFDDTLKPAYLELERGLMESRAEFKIECDNARRGAFLAYNDLMMDNPLLFDVKRIGVGSVQNGAIVVPEYSMSSASKQNLVSEIEEVRDKLIRKCTGMSSLQKEVAVHDHLVSNVTYDLGAPHAHDMVGAILDGRAVCQGIALATEYLLCSMGVDVGTVFGKPYGSTELHAWNIVFIDAPYHLDVTFDLGSFRNGPQHDFFNVSDEIMSRDREWTDRTMCNSMRMNYQSLRGAVVYRKEDLAPYIRGKLLEGEEDFEFRIAQGICRDFDSASVNAVARAEATKLRNVTSMTVRYNSMTGCCEISCRMCRRLYF